MSIYILLIFFLIIGYVILANSKLNNYKKVYCIIVVIILILVAGLRDRTLCIIDTDQVYIPAFENARVMNLESLINLYDKDALFFFFTRMFALFIENPQIYIFILSIPLNVFVGYLIYKESNSPILSFIMYLALNFYGTFSFTILRQGIAMSFLILAYFQIKNKKLLKFIIFVLIASAFHQTALIFLASYPLSNMKIGIKQFAFILSGFLIAMIFKNQLLSIILQFLQANRYQFYADRDVTLSLTSFLINCIILGVCYYLANDKINEKREYIIQYNLLIIGTFISAFTNVIAEAYRLSMNFTIFSIILLPNLIQKLSNKTRKTVYFAALIFFIAYFFGISLYNAAIVPYKTFWMN